MKYSFLATLIFTLVTFLITPSFASAQGNQNLNNAVQSVKQETGGRILSAKTVNKNGKRVHKIKVLLPSGKVQVFSVKAN